jgi:poly-gamma-glutamate synthesis protein (capsule biosynthesis protein)
LLSSPLKTTRLCFAGDLMLGRRVSERIGRHGPEKFWDDTLPILRRTDAVIANLESPITQHPGRWSEGWKAFRFAARQEATDILSAGNVRAVNLANNHILDCEAQGLEDTLRNLSQSKIAYAGAGLDLAQAWRPSLFRAGALTVGLIGATDNMKEFAAGIETPGAAYMAIKDEPATLALVQRLIGTLRQAGADIIVLSIHWGPNLRPWPPERFRRFARACVRAGVNVVHGHSAHLIQGVEAYEKGVILYDTGDFLDDYWVFPGIRIDHSFAFVVEYQGDSPRKLSMVPVILTPGRVSLARGEDFDAITRAMVRRSTRLGTSLVMNASGCALELDLAGAAEEMRSDSVLQARRLTRLIK